MSTKRKTISKSLRFEVFKRDRFTCQYCGKSAPEVVLEVDHITPVAEGGTNDLINLITSCRDCNRGKGKKKLSDKTTLEKQKKELDALADRKEQLDMMYQWKKELIEADNRFAELISDEVESMTGFGFNSVGMAQIKKLILDFGFDEVRYSTVIAFSTYYKDGSNRQWNKAFDKIGGICYNRKMGKINGEIQHN